jgi:hypothetical protein
VHAIGNTLEGELAVGALMVMIRLLHAREVHEVRPERTRAEPEFPARALIGSGGAEKATAAAVHYLNLGDPDGPRGRAIVADDQ